MVNELTGENRADVAETRLVHELVVHDLTGKFRADVTEKDYFL